MNPQKVVKRSRQLEFRSLAEAEVEAVDGELKLIPAESGQWESDSIQVSGSNFRCQRSV